MGMYTELVLGLRLKSDQNVINTLRYMLGEVETFTGDDSHAFFKTERWSWMLQGASYYFDGQTDSKLFVDDLHGTYHPMYYLNVRCSIKNYSNEIELFLDWLSPYIKTEGFIGYMRYEEADDPTLIYNTPDWIRYKAAEDKFLRMK